MVYVEECANVCLCVYWKAGSKFPTTVVIASSSVGLASTKKIIQKNEKWKIKSTQVKNLKKRLERKREREREADTEEKTRKKKRKAKRRKGPWQLPAAKPSGLCVDLSIQQTSAAVGQAATPIDASGLFTQLETHTHTHHVAPESSAAREHCSSQRVQCSAKLKTATAASCTGVRPSTWVAEWELQHTVKAFKLFSHSTACGVFIVCVLAHFTDGLKWRILEFV